MRTTLPSAPPGSDTSALPGRGSGKARRIVTSWSRTGGSYLRRERAPGEIAGPRSEAGALLAFQWETTPIGSVEAWPAELSLLVRVMLSSEFPMMIVWGDEYTQLYNDAFRPILGTGKHPGAMGRSARETWAEIWDEIGPLFASVFAGEAVWNADQRLLINRNGYDEETFFTYSYSPIYSDADVVDGLLVVATETTAQVVDRRRLSSIGNLASALVGATSIESVAEVTIDALRDSVPATAVEIDVVLADSVIRIASLASSPGRSDRSRPHPRRGELSRPDRAGPGLGIGSTSVPGGVRNRPPDTADGRRRRHQSPIARSTRTTSSSSSSFEEPCRRR